MNAESFTLKARRTTRVPLRVPVQLGIEEGGAPKTLDGWTVIVNIHGAKIESKRKMQLAEIVKVTVPLTRKTQSGKVVWAAEIASSNGNFEFAIELTEPGNLWGVGFPPSDWKEAKERLGPVAVGSLPEASSAPAAVLEAVKESKSVASAAPALPATTVVPAPMPVVAEAHVAIPEELPSTAVVASAPAVETKPAPKKIVVAGYQPQPIAPFTVSKPGVPAKPAAPPAFMPSAMQTPALQEEPTPKEPISLGELSAPVQPAAVVASAPAEIIESAPVPLKVEPPVAQPLPELPLELAEIALSPESVEIAEPMAMTASLQPELLAEVSLLPELEATNPAPAAAAELLPPQENIYNEVAQWMNGRAGDDAALPAPLPMGELFAGPAESLPVPAVAPLTLDLQPELEPTASVADVEMPDLELPAPVKSLDATLGSNETQEITLEAPVVPSANSAQVALVPVSVEAPAGIKTAAPLVETPVPAVPVATAINTAVAPNENSFARLAEMAETTFQSRMEGIIERASERAGASLEARLGEVTGSAIERLDKRLSAVCEDHYERLDQQSESLTAGRRLEFEQALTKFADAADEAARNRQSEMVSRSEQDLRRRSQEIALHAQGQVQRHSAEAIEAAQSNMAARLQDLLPAVEQAQRQAIEAVQQAQQKAAESAQQAQAQAAGALQQVLQQGSEAVQSVKSQTSEAVAEAQSALQTRLEELAPAIEKQITEQSRKQAEQIHYLHRGQFEAALSSRIEEARAYWQDQMVNAQQEAATKLNETVEKCMEQQSKMLLQQMETSLHQMAAQVQKTFFKHVVDELTQQQHAWMAQTQRRMENLTDRGMQQVRQQMMQLLGAMGEALVQDSQTEAETPRTESVKVALPF